LDGEKREERRERDGDAMRERTTEGGDRELYAWLMERAMEESERVLHSW